MDPTICWRGDEGLQWVGLTGLIDAGQMSAIGASATFKSATANDRFGIRERPFHLPARKPLKHRFHG
jgi:hypothetical protein